jgi:hypothetical protein
VRDLNATIAAVREDGRQRDTRCPAHEDHRASLSVGTGNDGRVLLHCHAGCSAENIVAAAGLRLADLFPESSAPQRRIVATYRYCTESGTHSSSVVRFEPKDFRQQRADGVWSVKGLRPLVYRLNEIQKRDAVIVAEGEKDVDRLWSLGLSATCNAGGAGKWKPAHTEQLKAAGVRRVMVIPDADETGRRHAEAVAESCARAGLTVKIVALPTGKDVSDYLDQGGTKDALVSIIRAATNYAPREIAAATLPYKTPAEIATLTEIRPLAYAPFIFANAILLFTGYAKRGKSSLLQYLVGCIVYGLECLLEPVRQTGVVYLTEERATTMRAGLARAGLLDAPRLHIVSRWDIPPSLSWPEIVSAAVATCHATQSRVLVIDTFPAWAGLRGDAENNSGDVMEALEPVHRAARDDLAIVIVQHDRKGGGAVGESSRGSSAFAGAVDTILTLRRPEGHTNPNQRVLEAVSRFDGVPEALVVERADVFPHPTGSRFEKNLYRVLGEPGAVELRRTETAILAALDAGPLAMDGLKKALPEHSPATIARAVEAVYTAGKVSRTGEGKKGSPYTYERVPEVSSQTSIPEVRDEKKPQPAVNGAAVEAARIIRDLLDTGLVASPHDVTIETPGGKAVRL